MSADLDQKILRDAEEAYGSLDSPNWAFVEKRYSNHAYSDIIKSLTELGPTTETTDLNDDVSVVLFVEGEASDGLTIWLSLVGKYACFSDAAGTPCSRNELDRQGLWRVALQRLNEEEIVLLEPADLRRQILFGAELTSIYEILFSTDGTV